MNRGSHLCVVWAFALLSLSSAEAVVVAPNPQTYINYKPNWRVNVYYDFMPGVNLSGTNLNTSYLPDVLLNYANLNHANLSTSYLARSSMISTNFTGANLQGSDLAQSNLSGAMFRGANLSRLTSTSARTSFYYSVLTGANLTMANLNGAYFYRSNLTNTNLLGVSLIDTDLRYADLTGAKLWYTDMTDFTTNSGANIGTYQYDPALIQWMKTAGAGDYTLPLPEPSTYGLIGIAALGVALAARRRKAKTA